MRVRLLASGDDEAEAAMMRAYYNENDPFAAEWSRELIREGEITEGRVDGRSIVEVEGIDVAGYGGSASRKVERVRQRDCAPACGHVHPSVP